MRCVWQVLLAALLLSSVAADEEIVLAIALFRHGARTPLHTLPQGKDPCTWPIGPRTMGQLTGTGEKQLYTLGKYYRDRYVSTHQLVSPSYNASEILVISSGTDRTVMSAYAAMLGLYPPGSNPGGPVGIQPIPIISSSDCPWTTQPDAIFSEYLTCPYVRHIKHHTSSTPEWQSVEKRYSPFMKRMKALFGLDYNISAWQIRSIFDPINCGLAEGCPLPAFLTRSDWSTISDIHRLKMHARTGKYDYLWTRMESTPILRLWDRFISDSIAGWPQARAVFFSGHDTTVEGVLATLNAWPDSAPTAPFGSHVELELTQGDLGEYWIRIYYQGEVVQLPGCGGPSCSIEEWRGILQRSLVDLSLCDEVGVHDARERVDL
ncbi:histidine-type phosphatase [Carpediemonas membranifera]|uniref:Histidine-type phosphatase n=1 Tax=Carpediemonas membranifera TaxID=201153 RepID=A0A8J6DX70_9EUKA|nr:histidine-type phosphatase [Carpediemonas membranifera]|eukprot:KAG9389484.1 histidine-type phosphatase [Carpediemonas membranifera]